LLFKEIANGALEATTNDAKDILGRAPTDVQEFVSHHRLAFI
jgi:hypothetical protein